MKRMVERVVSGTDTFKELLFLYVATVGLAAVVFWLAEEKPLGDSIWWAFVTAMTVGYGDIVPVTTVGRMAGGVLMHIVPLFIIPLVIVRLLRTFVRDEHEFTHAEQERIKADLDEIKRALGIAGAAEPGSAAMPKPGPTGPS
ncbi:MAG: potassium channel family protein [Proteobacteria bacterium]|nr:potassium channel family protein [Pseudomonadota bacterium]